MVPVHTVDFLDYLHQRYKNCMDVVPRDESGCLTKDCCHFGIRADHKMKPEEKARQKIDQLLLDDGWVIQDHKDLNLGASLGVSVREFPVSTGYADYMLFVDRNAAGALEAKPEGTTLTSAEYQSDKYLCSLPSDLPCFQNPLPFAPMRVPGSKPFSGVSRTPTHDPEGSLPSTPLRPCLSGHQMRILSGRGCSKSHP